MLTVFGRTSSGRNRYDDESLPITAEIDKYVSRVLQKNAAGVTLRT